jgi:hypothetical protein
MTTEQFKLAEDMLQVLYMLDGTRYTDADVTRLARGIALRSWMERELWQVFANLRRKERGNGQRN